MRKDLLASSLKAVREGREAAKAEAEKPRRLSGVLDVQRGLEQLAAGAARAISPAQIAESPVRDRFDIHDGLDELITSIKASGQRLPVLLRRVTGGSLPYEVVYGRRRIEACRQLGIDVQAYISEMDDREALISQGLENAARLQRSFIEQAVYAEQLLSHNFSRDEVCDVLAIDKTTLSRMLGIAEAVPAELIAAIGPAHDSGRRPWMQLRDALSAQQSLPLSALLDLVPTNLSSTDRLQAVLTSLIRRADTPSQDTVKRVLRKNLSVERSTKKLAIRCTDKSLSGFTAYLDAQLEVLLAEYLHLKDKEETPDSR